MRGFTLIETLVYIALYALIIGGVVVSVYAIIESSNRNQTKAMLEVEGLFILGKLEHSLTNADTVTTPTATSLSITDNSLPPPENPTIFSVTAGNMYVKRGNASPNILNNSNVILKNATFVYTKEPGDGVNIEYIKCAFTLETKTPQGVPYSQDFSTTKYINK